jgi:hypothetical protein
VGAVELIHLVQVRDRWPAVVNAVMNLWVLVLWSQSVTLTVISLITMSLY